MKPEQLAWRHKEVHQVLQCLHTGQRVVVVWVVPFLTVCYRAMVVPGAVLAVTVFSTPAQARLSYDSYGPSAHERHLAEASAALTSGCSLTAAGACASAQATCLNNLASRTQVGCECKGTAGLTVAACMQLTVCVASLRQAAVCGCYSQLGLCMKNAGCLNGTNEVRMRRGATVCTRPWVTWLLCGARLLPGPAHQLLPCGRPLLLR